MTFSDLSLNPTLLSVLDANKWITPTPIQARAVPLALQGKDILGIAQTGTGKTLAFGLPIVQTLSASSGNALILVPTRELAQQVADTLHLICRPFHMHTCLLIGGASMNLQLQNLRKQPRVVIATPGRLIDHLQQGTIRLHNVRFLVLDEADRMLDMGFKPQIEKILEAVPTQRQTMLFSATMPPAIRQITRKYMQVPETVEVAPAGTAAQTVEQSLYLVRRDQKKNVLAKLLDESSGSVLVFVRTKRLAAQLTKALHKNYPVAEIHSDRSQYQRQTAIDGFRSGKYRILIATDIAARGIDVKDIQLVINYDLPDEAESYIHRIGRTGRAGQTGQAVSLATPDQGRLVRDIERLLKKSINIVKHSGEEVLRFDGTAVRADRPPNPRHNRRGSLKTHGFRKLEKYEPPPAKEKFPERRRSDRASQDKPLYSQDSSDTGNYFTRAKPRGFRNPFRRRK
ncbi:superfamily II DNA and RNA helicases [Candidatus Termititenax persephonae]|uniref:Superfamily II DNA and RNA helicases n=1 Tax=Candidatus Termititenax persephonae TaxID=2218525 RepID=A0A388TF70_9BACT|nr:superfamily II DNA and RNA helicases [Candidatus Termititenax persephonae]